MRTRRSQADGACPHMGYTCDKLRNGMPQKGKSILRLFVDAINKKDWQALDLLVAEDFVRHSVAAGHPPVRSRIELVAFLHRESVTFPDAKEEILDMLEEEDRVAVRMRFQGTQAGNLGDYPPTGKRLTSEYLAIYRIRDGRIAEAWAEWDNLAALKLLGHLS